VSKAPLAAIAPTDTKAAAPKKRRADKLQPGKQVAAKARRGKVRTAKARLTKARLVRPLRPLSGVPGLTR
jgi:hypothetical protein